MGLPRPNSSMSHNKAVHWPGAGEDLAVRPVICLMTEPVLGWVEVGKGCLQLVPQFQLLTLNIWRAARSVDCWGS